MYIRTYVPFKRMNASPLCTHHCHRWSRWLFQRHSTHKAARVCARIPVAPYWTMHRLSPPCAEAPTISDNFDHTETNILFVSAFPLKTALIRWSNCGWPTLTEVTKYFAGLSEKRDSRISKLIYLAEKEKMHITDIKWCFFYKSRKYLQIDVWNFVEISREIRRKVIVARA